MLLEEWLEKRRSTDIRGNSSGYYLV